MADRPESGAGPGLDGIEASIESGVSPQELREGPDTRHGALMDLYLIRHGESDIPQDSVQHDYPLSELGREQARRLGERFLGLHIDRLITTPYRRTRETAGAIALGTGARMIEESALGAIDTGEMHHTPYSQRRERFPEFFANPSPLLDFARVGGESAQAFAERVTGAFVEKVWERHWREKMTVVLVCHTETINVILHHLFRMPYEGWMLFSIDHTSVTMLDVRLDRPRVRYINDTTHLGDLSRGHRGQVGGEELRPRLP
jgi:broad specificity phosphatase PhoE